MMAYRLFGLVARVKIVKIFCLLLIIEILIFNAGKKARLAIC